MSGSGDTSLKRRLPGPRSRSAEKRREIVTRAAELFDRVGYHSVNVGELANAVGIRKPTLYHYFAGKDAILFMIHEEFINLLIEKARARPRDLSARDELAGLMSDILSLMDTHRGHVRVFFEHYRELSADDQKTIAVKRDEYQAVVERVINRGIAEGSLRDVDARLASLAFFGMCNWAYQWYRSGGPCSSTEIAALFCDIFVNGLKA
jgi:TetR/AcrR family transcriptional regulator, cholesterol catabolism regulator